MRRDRPESSPDRSLSTPASDQVSCLSDDFARALGRRHPDRDGQFRYISEQAQAHQARGDPVISVDTKKKELVGGYKNAGREWHRAGAPVEVCTHDFLEPALGKAIPSGVYDPATNAGWVTVGTDHDTAGFAVASIRVRPAVRAP